MGKSMIKDVLDNKSKVNNGGIKTEKLQILSFSLNTTTAKSSRNQVQ